jgi:hypothetical protein
MENKNEVYAMIVLNHNEQPTEKWRDGVMTRMRMSIQLGGRQLCIFEQYCDFNLGAPIHVHAVEEVLEVIDGRADRQSVGADTRGNAARVSESRPEDIARACDSCRTDLRGVLRQ